MGMFSFVKGIGDKLFGNKDAAPAAAPAQTAAPVAPAEPSAQEVANLLLKRVMGLGIQIDGLSVTYNTQNDTAEIKGTAKTQADRERAILAVGNVDMVSTVVDHITVQDGQPESRMYTVKSGDTLSKIAGEVYGNVGDYNKIFEANKPMLSDPNKIYPGQVLRIPA